MNPVSEQPKHLGAHQSSATHGGRWKVRSIDNQAPPGLFSPSETLQHPHYLQQQQATLKDSSKPNEASTISYTRQPQGNKCAGDETLTEPLNKESVQLLNELAHYYKLDLNDSKSLHNLQSDHNLGNVSKKIGLAAHARELPELPKPSNVTVLIISWYPPILKLSWNLNELDESYSTKLDFYGRFKLTKSTNKSAAGGEFDLDLALDQQHESEAASGSNGADDQLKEALESLRRRRSLLRKSLTCFQVTYNVINSR